MSKYLEPILWAPSITDSGISTLASLSKDFTESNTSSLDLLVLWVHRRFEGKDVSHTVLIPPVYFGLICLISSIPTLDVSAFGFQIPNACSDFLISFWICLVISSRRSFKTLKTFVKFSSCSHILASKQHFCSSNFSSIFLVIIKTLFKKDKLCHSRKWIMVDVRGCYIIMH